MASALLNGELAQRAWNLWISGLDTHEIAKRLDVTEAEVFNTIRMLRELERKQFGGNPPADSGLVVPNGPPTDPRASREEGQPAPFSTPSKEQTHG